MLNLILTDIEHLDDYIQQLKTKFQSGPLLITIQEIKNTQYSRNIYFAKLGVLANEVGYTKSELHNFVKLNILPKITKMSEFIISNSDTTSTSCLNEAGYTKLITEIQNYFLKNTDIII